MSADLKASLPGLNRREFARLVLMSSAMLAGGSGSMLGEAIATHGSAPVSYYGRLRPLPPGAIRPEGWLRRWLQKQADQLGSHLPSVSWPFTEDYWGTEQEGAYFVPEQEYENWWPWEQRAYWIDGTCRLAMLLGDERLLRMASKPVEYTFLHPDKHGYLGPELWQDPLGDYHRWPQAVFFRGAEALADGKAPLSGLTPRKIAEVMERHYLSDTASYGKPKRNVNNVESILWCYQQTRNPRLLSMAENAWAGYMKYSDDPENGDLGFMRVMADTAINAHGETYAETAKQPALLYLYTGKQEYLEFALAAQRRIFDHHMLIDGIPSTSEWFSTVTSLDSHETCDMTDHTWSWGYFLMATGDAIWADRVERACFNAVPGALRNDWKGLQYFSCANQFLATLDSDHNWPKFPEHGGYFMAYQPNPGHRTACCGGNIHRVVPNYALRMWMKSDDGGLTAALYGPSTVKTTVGKDQVPIEIQQTTRYPFEEQISFRVRPQRPVAFPLSLRIPGWCKAPRIAINGVPVEPPQMSRGFAVLGRRFVSGDVVTLSLPMRLRVSRWPENGIGIERGPIVYSFPIPTVWSSKVIARYSTEEYPSWEARPAGSWNYGVTFNETNLEEAVSVRKESASEPFDPWEKPPISISVPARKIEDWRLQANPAKPDQKFTPCLPDLATSKVSPAVERITLVPYGSTELRLTIFPSIKS